MSSVKKIIHFPQGGLNYVPLYDTNPQFTNDLKLLGGVFQDSHYIWQAKGPVLEIRNTKSGHKVGAWVFGGILKDSNTKIVCVEELQRPNGRISLLVVGIECTISGGIICIFDVFSSKVIRAIQIKEKISFLHVVDPGVEDLNLPGPLRNFDGILAVGTQGGDVILLDICRQICEESFHFPMKKDELDPSQIVLLTAKHISKIEHYKEKSVRDGKHLGIHLNAVFENTTDHFVLKGPKGDDHIHVNREEVIISAVYYCSQLTSLLIGYNFGAFQLWNLTSLKLVYTSPVCEGHIPVTNFALQEPTDDPKAFCYIWVSYSNAEPFQAGLPFAVMYALCYESKEYHEGYGYLYQDFHYCNIRYQMELGHIEEHRGVALPKGGHCIGIQPITKHSTSKDSFSPSTAGDTSALCFISWTVWFSKSDTQTCSLIFDLNQWYKEQMPTFTKWKNCNNYIVRTSLTELIIFSGQKPAPILKVLLNEKSLTQFVGVQKLEEHFLPTSFSFNLWILRETDIVLILSQGLQKSLLAEIELAGPLCLVRPADVCRQAIKIGLTPIFVDILPSRALSIESQREFILNVALEHQLISWLCKCASEWANGSFSSAGCSLDFLITWAFQRAIVLKNNCDKYCAPLFDYSQSNLDSNTNVLFNSCTRQLSSLCVLYKHVAGKLGSYVNYMDVINEHCTRLEMVSMYFEVIQWLVNVGLLPECHPSTYPRPDNLKKISAPYPVQELTEYYEGKRAELCMLTKESFKSSESLLFIDNLVNRKCGGSKLLNLWQEDGGNGLYPPPSLQSLVRTYLVDGASISHKHSLVIYLFLDLAMALDQSRYSSVVTHLIKFPAVFKVSPSLIKITQAFWQLDHGDFTTAMDQLIDPFVLGEDLQSWHHTIAMRSLLINKQPNFALLYMKIRKPPISDEKDVLTAISLLIANKMLDEAFYFKKQHQNNNGNKLLTHLFQECAKNDALHLVLYKCLNSDEENTFFSYLKCVHNATSEDLQIFYYLLRSRLVEAFDTHSDIRRKGHDRQGLIGQSQSTKTDQIVKIFKTLLPEANRKLVDYIRRERKNLWKEVEKPAPMSVFVHNTQEQVQYKSTLIHAALAKAKHTFPNSFTEKSITEETPFIRTPTISKSDRRLTYSVITPKILDDNDVDEISAPSPCKRMRLSPRLSTAELNSPLKTNAQQITRMSIVNRKLSLQQDYTPQNCIGTLQSILKVRNLVQNRDSITDTTFSEETNDYEACTDPLFHTTSLRLQSRASISHTPKHQHVQFEKTTRFFSSLSDQSGQQHDTSSEDLNHLRSSLSSKDISAVASTVEDDEISDEVFYSPDNSVEDEKTETVVTTPSTNEVKEAPKEIVIENSEEIKEPDEIVMRSPRGRRSYKGSLGDSSPVRSSPRLSKLQSKKSEDQETMNKSSPVSEKSSTSDDWVSSSPKPKPAPKIKGRKSLSRQVLKHNNFSKILDSFQKEFVTSKELSFMKTEKITATEISLEKSKVTSVKSNIQIVDKESFETDSITTKSHSVSGYVTKKQNLESTTFSDSSVSLEYVEQEYDSDRKNIELIATDKKLTKKQLDFEEDEPVRPEAPDERERFDIVSKEDEEEEPHRQTDETQDKEQTHEENEIEMVEDVQIVQTQDNQNFPPFQDDAELPSKNVYEDIYDVNEDYKDEDEERSYNELEMNIFGLEEESRRDTMYSMDPESNSSDVSNMEKEFITDCFATPDTVENDVVVIINDDEKGSSDYSDSSSSKSDGNSGYSNTTEENQVEFNDNSNDISDEKSRVIESPFEEGKLIIDESEKNDISGGAKIVDIATNISLVDHLETKRIPDVTKENIKDIVTNTNQGDHLKTERFQDATEKDVKTSAGPKTKKLETSKRKTSGHCERGEVETSATEQLQILERKTSKNPEIEKETKKRVDDVKKPEDTLDQPTVSATQKKPSKADRCSDTTALTEEPMVNEDGAILQSVTDIEPIMELRVCLLRDVKRHFTDYHTTSSSDTTEGETFRKELVTVQVHTSNKDKKEETRTKMRTRQDDAPTQLTDINDKSDKKVADKKKELVSAKRTRRAFSASDTPVRTATSRPICQVKIDCDPNDSFKLLNDGSNSAVKLTLRKKRSASVDIAPTFSRQVTLKRNESTNEVKEKSGDRRAMSVSNMPVISEETPDGQARTPRKAKSTANSYTSARRLTRRQANLIKDVASVSKDDIRPIISLDVDDIDPIKLLDLDSFEGKPDPDEKDVYESPSPSSSANSQTNRRRRRRRRRRRSRSNSISTEISTSHSHSITKRATRSETKIPISTGVSTRSRNHSETSSVVSEHSESSTTPKRARKKKLGENGEAPSTAMSTRSRTASISSDKSDLSNSSRTVVRARRGVAAKSDLPEIVEEKVTENVSIILIIFKSFRKKVCQFFLYFFIFFYFFLPF
ncbi:unnamed protein product, partial [Psylliodes chrysocephalus]